MSHVCDSTCLPLCKHRMAGDGGIGRMKATPSVVGRDKREQAYAAAHPNCECGGCQSGTHAFVASGVEYGRGLSLTTVGKGA